MGRPICELYLSVLFCMCLTSNVTATRCWWIMRRCAGTQKVFARNGIPFHTYSPFLSPMGTMDGFREGMGPDATGSRWEKDNNSRPNKITWVSVPTWPIWPCFPKLHASDVFIFTTYVCIFICKSVACYTKMSSASSNQRLYFLQINNLSDLNHYPRSSSPKLSLQCHLTICSRSTVVPLLVS